MYDKNYAQSWIKAYESKKDWYRTDYLEPYLEDFVNKLPSKCNILDVGCGWGALVKFLKKDQKYTGVDPVGEFFPYIRENSTNRNIKLVEDGLPKLSKIKGKYDCIICSMTLHTVEDLEKSMKSLNSLLSDNGTILIVDFNDASEKLLRSSLKEVFISKKNHIRGMVEIAS